MSQTESRFFGERVREAREARGMTALQLAELIGVSKQAVSLYEKAQTQPSVETLEKIARTLSVPQGLFFQSPVKSVDGPVFYRSMAAATKRMRSRAERKFDWLRSGLRVVQEFVEFPKVSFPKFDPPADPDRIDTEDIEQAAHLVRSHWKLGGGVIENVTLALENAGILTSRFELGSEKLDSVSIRDEQSGHPVIIMGSDKKSAVRSRFDAAHELGHLVLHRNVPKGLLKERAAFRTIEDQAHRFAGAFLLPQEEFSRDFALANLNALKRLKPKWKVSIGLMIKRSAQIGLLSEDQAHRLWVNRTRKGWNRCEPYDDEWAPESPVLLSRSVQMVVKSGALTRQELQDRIALFPRDIETLFCLPHGYMDDSEEIPETPDPAPKLLRFPRDPDAPQE